MTSPSRRKRPITRLNTKAPKLTDFGAVALGLWLAATAASVGAAEQQWRTAKRSFTGANRPLRPATARHDASVAAAGWNQSVSAASAVGQAGPANDAALRSIVVQRGDEPVARQAEAFDPFEAEMPSTAPAPQPTYDPFDDPTTGAPALERSTTEPKPIPKPSLEEAFDEPSVELPPSPAEDLEKAGEAIDREIMRREAERGVDDELVLPEPPLEQDETDAEESPDMADEIVDHAPDDAATDDELSGPEIDDDAPLQYGGQAEPLPPPTPEQLEERRRQIEKERRQIAAECERLYDAVQADDLKDISLDIRLQGTPGEDFPFACEGRRPEFQSRNWSPVVYHWKASGLCHKPLYFEQTQLERYGHDWGPALQPLVSGAHFFGTVPLLPYKMGLQTPNECDYTLGYYRPGSCAPYMIEPLGFTWRAAAFEAGAATGAAFVIP